MHNAMRKVFFRIILAASFCMVGAQSHAGLQEGISAYKNGDYRAALKQFKPLAAKGDMAAQNSLGDMYANGNGVTQDYKQAEIWYRKAAEQGHARAQYNLGFLYQNGLGVQQDFKLAAAWYQKSSEQITASLRMNNGEVNNHEQALSKPEAVKRQAISKKREEASKINHLDNPVADGTHTISTPVDKNRQTVTQESIQEVPQGRRILEEAAVLFRKGAEQGSAEAQFNIGLMYDNGQGVTEDRKEAAKWYLKSAQQGYASAQINLGKLYIKGDGVPYDYQQAVKWFSKAAEQGSEEANRQKDMLKRSTSFH